MEPLPRRANERNHVGGRVPQYLGLRRLLALFRDIAIPSEWEYHKPIIIHHYCRLVAGRRWLLLVFCFARRVASLFVWQRRVPRYRRVAWIAVVANLPYYHCLCR